MILDCHKKAAEYGESDRFSLQPRTKLGKRLLSERAGWRRVWWEFFAGDCKDKLVTYERLDRKTSLEHATTMLVAAADLVD